MSKDYLSKLLMDALQNHGVGIMFQLAASGAAFGSANVVWGLFRGSVFSALRVVSVSGVLGLALASVYIVSDRIVRRALSPTF